MQAIYDDYQSEGFVAIAININEDMNTVKSYARQHTFPFLRDNGGTWNQYTQNGATPLDYVIDPAGIVRFWEEGFSESSVRNAIQQWLPADHDVGVFRIPGLPGTLDSGTVVTPACSVFNFGRNAESYQVRMKIGTAYNNTVTVSGHASGTAQYVTFPDWIAGPRGSKAVTCSTELSGDERTGNDRVAATTLVQVYDFALTAILAPVDSVDSGSAVTPSVVVQNPGSVGQRIKIKCHIGGTYQDSATVSLMAGRTDTLDLPVWTASPLGDLAVKCTLLVVKDLNPANNLLTGTVRVVHSSGIEELQAGELVSTVSAVPNPTLGSTVISYALTRDQNADISIFAASGALVRRLFAGRQAAGSYRLRWDGMSDEGYPVQEGVYYCRVKTDGPDAVLKVVKTR